MLNEIEKAYKKSDVYLEVLSYLLILIAVCSDYIELTLV